MNVSALRHPAAAAPVAPGALSRRLDTAVRLTALVVVTAVAYQRTLRALVADLGAESPLAYTALVPLVAALVALTRARPADGDAGPGVRPSDRAVGLALLGAASVVNLAPSIGLTTVVWAWRLDALSLPLFVAGGVVLLFGSATAWRQRFAIALLVLAWPLPYSVALVHVLGPFSDLTVRATSLALDVTGFATPVAGQPGSFRVTHQSPFLLDVAAACSGISGTVGFLLVGTAFGAVTTGPRRTKVLWVLTGLAVMWVLNLVRILVIFGAGERWGSGVALDWLHPYLGLVTFNVGIVVMLVLLRPMGLRLRLGTHEDGAQPPPGAPGGPGRARAPLGPVVATLAAFALVLGVGNQRLGAYDLATARTGPVAAAGVAQSASAAPGWSLERIGVERWAHAHLGASSTWTRYRVSPAGAPAPGLVADVLTADHRADLASFGPLAISRDRGRLVTGVALVDLAGGVRGQLWSYRDHEPALAWIRPVRGDGGAVRWEQVALSAGPELPDDTLVAVARALLRAQAG